MATPIVTTAIKQAQLPAPMCTGRPSISARRQYTTPISTALATTTTDTMRRATGLNVTGTLRVRDISQPVTFHATRSTTAGPPRYHATVVVSPKEYGITRLGTTKPVKVILDVTLERV
jgi:YceI-like domain